MASKFEVPGRLGDPNMSVGTDPRTHPALRAAMQAMKIDGNSENHLPTTSDVQMLHENLAGYDDQFIGLYNGIDLSLPEDKDEGAVEESEIEIDGPDGNKIKLFITKPKGASKDKPLPGLVYIHGGGMVFIPTDNNVHRRWVKSLALQGLVTVMVDFRNAWSKAKHRPFPAGLNDCATAVKWIAAHRAELGIDKFALQGESGGANLSLATAIKANREGWIKEISGVYGYVPYVSGAYGWRKDRAARELPSLVENDGYFINVGMTTGLAYYYSPGKGELEDPLAWPYHAQTSDLKGLPPVYISCDELDPLRDEGLAFYRKLLDAEVDACAEVNLGVTHGGALMFRNALPNVNKKHIRNIAAFTKEVCQ